MTTKPFDPTKPVQTRDGHSARIVCTDFNRMGGTFGQFCILALVQRSFDHSGETVSYYTHEGRFWSNSEDHPFDLVNVPVRTSTWQNVCETSSGAYQYKNKMSADTAKALDTWGSRIGYLRRDFEDGVFVFAEFEPLTNEE